jgi:signal transduction histidine kinase
VLKFFCLFAFGLLNAGPCSAWAVELTTDHAPQDVTSQVSLTDLPANAAGTTPPDNDFQPASESEIHLPYTTNQLWLKLTLSNPRGERTERVLYLSSPLTGDVELRVPNGETLKSGSSMPLAQRAIPTRLTAFPITIPAHETLTFYLLRQSHHSLSTRLFVAFPETFQELDSEEKAFLFFYLGGLLCLILYNLAVGIYTRDIHFLLYSVFAISFATATSCVNGVDAYLFPNLSFSCSHHLMVFSSLGVISGTIFVYNFLNIRETLPQVRPIFALLVGLALITFVAGFFSGPHLQPLGYVIDSTIALSALFLLVCAVIVYWRGYVLAKFMIFSWASLLAGILAWYAMMVGWLPHFFVTQNALIFGNLGEMLIISLGLAYKINILDHQARLASHQAKEKERYHLLVKVLSHDIANALQVAGLYVLRLTNASLTPQELKSLNRLNEVIAKMRQTLGFVREEEKLKSFQEAVKLSPVDLNEVVTEVMQFFEEPIQEKKLQLSAQIPERICVKADKGVLANQVLSNILSNAIKYSRMSGEIKIECNQSVDCIDLHIKDFGVGITNEDIQKAFFSNQLISTRGTSAEVGSGMGASLAREYMKLFKGELLVDSIHESTSPHSGTTVTLRFPR